MQSSVSFYVKPGKITRATARLQKGSNLIFRFTGNTDRVALGTPCLRLKLTDPRSGKPMFKDEYGPYWYSVLHFNGTKVREAKLTLPPGRYQLDMKLRYNLDNSDREIRDAKRSVTVVAGKDSVIDIMCER